MSIPAHLTEFGRLGERYVAGKLRELGLTVELIGGKTDFDLLISGTVRVEVKSAMPTDGRPGRRPRYQFSMRRHGLPIEEELIILCCFADLQEEDPEPAACFVIPGDLVPAKLKKIDVTAGDPKRYRGRWAPYLDRWDLVADVLKDHRGPEQPPLFRDRDKDPGHYPILRGERTCPRLPI